METIREHIEQGNVRKGVGNAILGAMQAIVSLGAFGALAPPKIQFLNHVQYTLTGAACVSMSAYQLRRSFAMSCSA